MAIKYADITIIMNVEAETIFRTFERYIFNESYTNDNDTIIMEFDDGTICDTRNEYIDKEYKFEDVYGRLTIFPSNFQIKDTDIKLYYKGYQKRDGCFILNFRNMFKNYKKYKIYKDSNSLDASRYNMIYEDINKKEIVAICKLKSTENKPRFIIAYDSNVLDRSNLIYLVDCLLKEKY
jgi:hypothetical protein